MKKKDLKIFIDGEQVEYTRFLDNPVWCQYGGKCGYDQVVDGTLWCTVPTNYLYGLAITNDDEGWSINGVFKRGEWKTNPEDEQDIEYHVWERIA